MEYKARIGSPVQLVDGVGSGWVWAIVIGCQFGGVRTRFICPIPVLAQQIQNSNGVLILSIYPLVI